MSLNETPYEEYKGWYIIPGITMPSQGIFEFNVYTSLEKYFVGEPSFEGSNVGEARTWIDRHHSIYGPEREELVRQYGTWAVGRAESVCPEDDVECVRREAARLLQAYRGG